VASGYIASGETMGSPRSAHITMGTYEYPNGTVTISGTWRNRQALACYYDVDICDSAGNNATNIGRFQINGASSYGPNDESKTVSKSVSSLTNLKGKAIYVKLRGVGSGPDNSKMEPKGNVTVTIATATQTFTITTASNTTGCTVSASASSATPGTTITLSSSAKTGYYLSSYSNNQSVTISNGQFTMPASNITVTGVFALISYTISTSAVNGKLLSSSSTGVMGQEITLYPTANTGCSFSSYTKSPSSLTITSNKFTMPASNVSVTANFTKNNYTVSKVSNPSAGGSVTLGKTSAQYGDQVTVSASANTGYAFSSWSTNVSGVSVSNGKFTMPASNITITANFSHTSYTVSKASSPAAGGTVTLSKTSAYYGDSVTVTATPNAGYAFSSWSTNVSGVSITNNAFTMPASNITITANFVVSAHTITGVAMPSEECGTIVLGKTSAVYGETVEVSAIPNTGYVLSGWSTNVSGVSVVNGAFTMPNSNITITGTFALANYNITCSVSPENSGTISTDVSTAHYGDTVTITEEHASGYRFASFSTDPPVPIVNNQFTMPGSDISIIANYDRADVSTASVGSYYLIGGSTCDISIRSVTASASHTYKISFGTNMESDWITVPSGTLTDIFTVPTAWIPYLTNADTKRNGTLTLRTYMSNELIGESVVSGLIFVVPQTVVPTLSSITASVARTIDTVTYANIGNYYVQNHCGVNVQATASGSQGSTIASYKIWMTAYPDNDIHINGTSLNWTSGLLKYPGNIQINVTAIDTRGRWVTQSTTINVVPYSPPVATLNVWRTDSEGVVMDEGQHAKYKLTKSFTQVGTNAVTWSLESGNDSVSSPANSGFILPGNMKTFGSEASNIVLTVSDAFETTTITTPIANTRYLLRPGD